MHDTATTFVERQPGFYQERSTLSLDEMMKREVDPVTGAPTVVRDLFDYWQERHAGGPPPAAGFDPQAAFTPEASRWVSWIDADNRDSLNFLLCSHPGYVFGDWSGKRLRDYHNSYHARSCGLEYMTCLMVQKPFYHEIRQTIGAVSRAYVRLLLPVADRNRAVKRLFYAIRHTEAPVEAA